MIAEEAGGLVTGSHEAFEATKNTGQFGVVTEEILTGRKYLVIRGLGDTKVSTVFSWITLVLTSFAGGDK